MAANDCVRDILFMKRDSERKSRFTNVISQRLNPELSSSSRNACIVEGVKLPDFIQRSLSINRKLLKFLGVCNSTHAFPNN